ncbi:MAG: DUF6115 domain-containing protein [Clostridiales bacterium]|nr:DUF6115 domain-containing protein [Clostridiales bacterium]
MAALEVTLILIGIIFVIGSFFVEERLSKKDIDKMARLSEEEMSVIVERQLREADDQIEETIERRIEDSKEGVQRAMDKETNEKIMAINEYSNTVIEAMNKTHNEILFLYNMLNDKHVELTELAGQIQQFSDQVRSTQNEVMNNMSNMAEASRGYEQKSAPRQELEPPETYFPRPKQAQRTRQQPQDDSNHNDRILELHRQGVTDVEIARELGLGVGEVRLVIDLYKGGQNW